MEREWSLELEDLSSSLSPTGTNISISGKWGDASKGCLACEGPGGVLNILAALKNVQTRSKCVWSAVLKLGWALEPLGELLKTQVANQIVREGDPGSGLSVLLGNARV